MHIIKKIGLLNLALIACLGMMASFTGCTNRSNQTSSDQGGVSGQDTSMQPTGKSRPGVAASPSSRR